MNPINDRCPLQGECERKKCEFKNRELECAYYHSNARPGYEIADQEANRYPGPDLDEEDPAEEEEQAPPHINGLLCRLPIDKLVPHPDNPRKDLLNDFKKENKNG